MRASIDAHAPDNGDDLLVSGYTGRMRWGDLRTILAALPTPEERAALDTTIRVAESFTEGHAIAWKKGIVRDKVKRARSYYTRTGGATDGE